MQTLQTDIMPMASDHLPGALHLSQQAGWPHRLEDWALTLSLSRGFVAVEGSRVFGTALATLYGTHAATINMVIVDESMRGQGLGRKLMEQALAAAEDRECRLVATADGLPLYEKLGFRVSGEIVQHQGPVGAIAAREDVRWEDRPDLAAFATMDADACGMDRRALYDALATRGRFAVLERGGLMKGFAVLRPFGRGEVAGPVVAENAEDAKALLSFLFAGRGGAFMRVDTPKDSGLAPWLTTLGLLHVGGGLPMIRNSAPRPAATVKTFGLASQALG
ncbi:GNAT family N-acetyltransferase [Rhizobium paknamense]|uniref:GNAT superfamily N-acetyltransferase n=1 Tax=Rhizobium paknamense TaxID=1206817 RepID=A0ABU0IIC5_9HYPH|nr:GNAT family N-acetyltransferase [Rhizobium paknamense]MDQ0458012.1 GNAT superfamily N-acetyltransferase [Rhizobium paknamense]